MPVCIKNPKSPMPRELIYELVSWIPLDKIVWAEQKVAAQNGANGRRQTPLDAYRHERFTKLASELQFLVGQMDQEKIIQECCNESWFGSSRYLSKDSERPIFIKLDEANGRSMAGWKLVFYGKLAFGSQQRDIVCKCPVDLGVDKLIEFIQRSTCTDLVLDDVELRWPVPVKWPKALRQTENQEAGNGMAIVGAFSRGARKFAFYEVTNRKSGEKFMLRIGGADRCQKDISFQEMQIYRNADPYPMFK